VGGIHLLFTVNVWIKKSQRDEYPKYLMGITCYYSLLIFGVVNIQNNFLGIISHHTSLKEVLIVIEDISIFLLRGLRAVRV
jgi:antibiotic biosynthesis monooxygenase (ABM) superfamily enzyme